MPRKKTPSEKTIEKPKQKKPERLKTMICQRLYGNAFEFYIYDNSKNMIAAAKQWGMKNGSPCIIDDDTIGVVVDHGNHPVVKFNDDDVKVYGAIFLSEEDISVEIVAHEAVHATMEIEREAIRYMGGYHGNEGTGYSAEERLAYTVAELTNEMLKEIEKAKIKCPLTTKVLDEK